MRHNEQKHRNTKQNTNLCECEIVPHVEHAIRNVVYARRRRESKYAMVAPRMSRGRRHRRGFNSQASHLSRATPARPRAADEIRRVRGRREARDDARVATPPPPPTGPLESCTTCRWPSLATVSTSGKM